MMNKKFITDLGLASVLVTLKYILLELERSNPRKICFVFEEEKGINEDIADYWADKIKLPAQTLLNNQRALKNRVYSGA